MTKDEALKLALEALESCDVVYTFGNGGYQQFDRLSVDTAITAIKQALAAPVQEPVQDSTCNETLRGQGKAYPRTCKKCGLGPCIGAPKQPPAQPAPVQKRPQNCGTGYCSCIECVMEPAPMQEPVAIALNTGTKQGVKWLKNVEHGVNLYTTSPQRTWVGLTDEEIAEAVGDPLDGMYLADFRKVEAKLKEKNFD